jgi:hypothetical protein
MAKTKQIPHVEVMSRKYAANKALLLTECNVSLDAYNIYMYNQAIAWIRSNIWNDDAMVDALTEQALFWAWWINQWNMREDAFIHECLEYIISGDDFSDILHHGWVGIHVVTNINVQINQPEWLQDAYNNIISQTFKTLNR